MNIGLGSQKWALVQAPAQPGGGTLDKSLHLFRLHLSGLGELNPTVSQPPSGVAVL